MPDKDLRRRRDDLPPGIVPRTEKTTGGSGYALEKNIRNEKRSKNYFLS